MKTTIKKLFVLTFIGFLFISTSHAQWKSIKGNGNMTTVTRTTSDYDAIKCAGFMNFILVKGKEGNIKIEGEENLMEYIVTEVKNNALVVKVKNGKNLKPSKKYGVKITIPFTDIEKVSLSGSGDLRSEDKINTENLHISLAGAGDIILNVDAALIKSSLSGSGDITLKGNAGNLVAKVAGSGNVHGFNLETNNTEASIAGSGGIEVLTNTNLKARIAGSGDVLYKGSPKVDSKVSGSGTVSAK